jgi:hypothetical protein
MPPQHAAICTVDNRYGLTNNVRHSDPVVSPLLAARKGSVFKSFARGLPRSDPSHCKGISDEEYERMGDLLLSRCKAVKDTL